jgi:MFS family permease
MSNFFNFKRDRSLSYLHGEGASSSVENAAIAYQAPSLLAAGGTARDVALLATITNLIFALLLVKVPSVVKFGDSLKRAVVVLSIIATLGWVPLILISIFVKGISPSVLIILWVINLVPSLLTGPLVDKWLSDLVSSNKLGRYLSIRAIFSTGAYLSFFYIMGYTLDHFKSNLFSGFSVIYVIAFSASLGSLLLCILLKTVIPLGESNQSDFGLIRFVREAKQNNLGIFILFTASMMFATGISSAFFSVYMLKDLHFTYFTFTLVVSIEIIARIAVSYLGGRWIDSAGAMKVLRYASMIIPFVPILWLFSANIGYLMAIQVLSGVAWATFDLSTQSYLCRDTPQAKRLHYMVYYRSVVTLASAIGPLVGAGLLNVIYPVLGNTILGIFLLSGVLRLLAVITILPRLKTTEAGCQDSELESGETFGRSNYPVKPGRIETQPYLSRNFVRKPVKLADHHKEPAIKQGNFYHPEMWEYDLNKPSGLIKENLRQDLLYRIDRRSQPSTSLITSEEPSDRVLRLKDNLSRDIEYHKRWASGVPCS